MSLFDFDTKGSYSENNPYINLFFFYLKTCPCGLQALNSQNKIIMFTRNKVGKI